MTDIGLEVHKNVENVELEVHKYRLTSSESQGDLMEKIEENLRLHKDLERLKLRIDVHNKNKKWDKYKRFCNEYELVFTSTLESIGVAGINPVSRSFFKLHEMIHDFRDVHPSMKRLTSPEPIKGVFVGEGPGGFVEALCYLREFSEFPRDFLYGMTLINPRNKSIPEWKLTSSSLRGNSFTIVKGIDGTGDLYNMKNVDALVTTVGANQAHLVTADGGFDFSDFFTTQEEVSFRLISSEIFAALRLLIRGGVFFLKVYDVSLPETLHLVSLLVRSFDDVYVSKPKSSRSANSEKYLVCMGYRGPDSQEISRLRRFLTHYPLNSKDIRQYHRQFLTPTPQSENPQSENPHAPQSQTPHAPQTLLSTSSVIEMNRAFIDRQSKCIQKTIDFIGEIDSMVEKERQAVTSRTLARQVESAKEWCRYYGIPTI